MGNDAVRAYEWKDIPEDERKALKKFKDTMDESEQFVRPYFEKASRFELLYHMVLPEELDCTYSKCMLPIAVSMIQNEIPRQASTLFSTESFFDLDAEDRRYEHAAEGATNWLNYQARKKNRIFPKIIPTLQCMGITGTAYRAVTHQVVPRKSRPRREPTGSFAGIPTGFKTVTTEKDQLLIVSQNVDFYSILPSPNGGQINTLEQDGEERVEWLHWIQYLSEDKLRRISKKNGFRTENIERMLKTPSAKEGQQSIDQEFRQIKSDKVLGIETPDWISRTRDKNVDSRYRCVWSFYHDEWTLIGENRFVIYKGPQLLDWIPIAKYIDTPNLTDFFGRGRIEITEDIILSYLLTHNYRMDYLVGTFHPTKFIRDDIVKLNKGEMNDFDPTPYGLFKFSSRIRDIQKAVWYDRFPDLSPQAFMEDTKFQQLLQEATGQPNYMKGQGGAGTLANETATGIVSLIEEGTAQSSMRSLITEYEGLHHELMLMLKWGKKYVWEDQEVEIADHTGKWRWRDVPHELIDDGYGIELKGTRVLVHKNEMVKRMMSVLPMILNNPNAPGQKELLSQVLEKVEVFTDIEKILGASPDAGATLGPVPAQAGVGGTPTVQNEAQAVTGALPQAAEQTAGRFAV